MPGNKNSGRKRKLVPDPEINEILPEKPPKKRGRPRKTVVVHDHEKSVDKTVVVHDLEKSVDDKTVVIHDLEKSTPESLPINIKDQQSVASRRKSIPHVTTLSRRSSVLSQSYDRNIGAGKEFFPSSHLPNRREVLQRYRYLRSQSHTQLQFSLVSTITSEISLLWDNSAIPRKSDVDCQYMVKCLINQWLNANPGKRESVDFQNHLNQLLDLRPNELMELSVFEKALTHRGFDGWEADIAFFKGQLVYPQKMTMSTNRDMVLHKRIKKRQERSNKRALYNENNCGDGVSCSYSTSTTTSTSSRSGINTENIVTDPRRKAFARAHANIADQQVNKDVIPDDPEWELPYREARRQRARPDEITITLPAKEIPTLMAGASTATKTSIRLELKLLSTILKAGGADINEASLSISTIFRQRRKEVQAKAGVIKEKIKLFGKTESCNVFLVLHWDGKIIQLLSGETEDRLAIALSAPNVIPGQFLASPVIPAGTGLCMSNAVHELTAEYGLRDKVRAVVFDTTASNTGCWRGSVTIFEKQLGRPILWLACRHHIIELHIKHANETLRGPSKGPEDGLFKRFKKLFPSLDRDRQQYSTWKGPVNPSDWRSTKAATVLQWANNHMELGTWSREDYRELLELVVIFLGGVTKRVRNNQVVEVEDVIRLPGACHRARFMASCLYLLKIYLFNKQLDADLLDYDELDDIEILVEYIALIHVPYFLQCPLAVAAPRLDRDFWVDVCQYKKLFHPESKQYEMLDAVQESLLLHLWYLTEQLVVFSLFDTNLPVQERNAMASKLIATRKPRGFVPGKPSFPVNYMTENPSLADFTEKDSWFLFHVMECDGVWLQNDASEWENNEEFIKMSDMMHDLKVVNDLAERCVKDIEEYANATKDVEHRDNVLLVATDHRGIFQDLRKQSLQ